MKRPFSCHFSEKCYNEIMNKLLKRAGSAWLIFIKNKLAGAVMMFISGFMMAIAGINGNGNDTKTLPAFIALFGFCFSLWSFYRVGYLKSNMDKESNREQKATERRAFYLQIGEAIVYLIIVFLGVYLFVNESFTNTVLDLMAGGFTILNGVFGILYIVKNRDNKTFWWKFRFFLTALEFIMGFYFIFASNSIDASGYLILGSTTTVAGIIEVINALRQNALKDAIKDSKDMIRAFKDEPSDRELEDQIEELSYDDED